MEKKVPERRKQTDFEEKLLEVRRVTKVTTWWRRLSFRATVLVGNKKWKVGIGVGKGTDVSIAVKKATHDAYKHVQEVFITKDWSVLYSAVNKTKACIVKILPAAPGTGIKAWSSVRLVLEFAWFKNILSKIIWSNNKLNNATATIGALLSYKLKETHKGFIIKNEEDTDKKQDSSKHEKSNIEKQDTKMKIEHTKEHIKDKNTKEEIKKEEIIEKRSPKKEAETEAKKTEKKVEKKAENKVEKKVISKKETTPLKDAGVKKASVGKKNKE